MANHQFSSHDHWSFIPFCKQKYWGWPFCHVNAGMVHPQPGALIHGWCLETWPPQWSDSASPFWQKLRPKSHVLRFQSLFFHTWILMGWLFKKNVVLNLSFSLWFSYGFSICSMNFATGFPAFFPSAHVGLAHVGRCWDLARKIPLEFPDWWLRILTTDFLLVDTVS